MFSLSTISLKNVTRNINTKTAGLIAALCCLTPSVQAGTLSIGFEAPTYTGSAGLGTPLGGPDAGYDGQDGWSAPSSGATGGGVSTGATASGLNPLAGSQSLYMQGDQGTSYALHSTAGVGWADGSTQSILAQVTSLVPAIPMQTTGDIYSFDMAYDPDGFSGSPQNTVTIGRVWLTADPNTGAGELQVHSGAGLATVTNIGPAVAGDVYQITDTLNFTAQTFDVSVKDVTTNATVSGSGFAFYNPNPNPQLNPITAAYYDQFGSVGLINIGSFGSVMWDNLSINTPSVPEPSSVVLLALGALGLAFVAKRRRK